MTDETTQPKADPAVDPADLERRLAQAEERLAFYASFDKLIQDNIARSSELMRDALELREQASAEMLRAHEETERVRTEADRIVAEAGARADAERRRFGEALLSVQAELAGVQDATATIARRVGAVLGELGVAEFVPVTWAAAPAGAAALADEPIPAAAEDEDRFVDARDTLPPAADAEVVAQAEIAVEAEVAPEAEPLPSIDDRPTGVWDPLASPSDPDATSTGQIFAYSRTGTSELSLDTEAEPGERETTDDAWEAAVPAYPIGELPDDGDIHEAASVVGPSDEERTVGAEGGETGVDAPAHESTEPVELLSLADGWPRASAPDGDVAALGPRVAPADTDAATDGATGNQHEPAALAASQAAYREEGFLGGIEAHAEVEAETAIALGAEAEPELRGLMVLVHGVPRAAAALSLQRHLAGLAHVDSVEAREYAEGILRLQVTSRRPLDLDDLRTWDGGSELEPVHVQDDVLEVRLPGAHGF